MSKARSSLSLAVLAIAACCVVLAPSAQAASVVNGDFETGLLNGWTSYSDFNAGVWNTYSGSGSTRHKAEEIEIGEEGESPSGMERPFFAPPQGTFAALNEQGGPDTSILFQDIALEPGWTHQLSLTLYYRTESAIAIPSPDTLKTENGVGGIIVMPGEPGFENQQVRVDLVKPTAPLESLAPGDILATLYASKPGDPETLPPTVLSANLTPFAGQTVRLRVATAINEGPMEAAVDAVSVASTPPSNVFKTGKLTLNKKKGTGSLGVTVPGPGVLGAADAAKKGKPKLIKPATVNPTAAGKVKLALKPNGAGLKALEGSGKLAIKTLLTFTPTNGLPATQTFKGKLKLKPTP